MGASTNSCTAPSLMAVDLPIGLSMWGLCYEQGIILMLVYAAYLRICWMLLDSVTAIILQLSIFCFPINPMYIIESVSPSSKS